MFRLITSDDISIVTQYIIQLYVDDPGSDTNMTSKKAHRTIHELMTHPEKGMIMVFELEKDIVGYSIVIHFWSNEFGGTILDIDELFVHRNFRGRGIAGDFLEF